MTTVELNYIAAGGNRHSSAADWSPGLLAFGAGNDIALWNPIDPKSNGIHSILSGHSAAVNAVRIYGTKDQRTIISGSADNTVRLWKPAENASGFEQVQCITDHVGSVNIIAGLPDCNLFVTGAADGTIKIYQFEESTAQLIQSISLKPRYLPLAAAVTLLSDGSVVLAIAGTTNVVQIFCRSNDGPAFELQATLTGHEGWIRSLDFTHESDAADGDILLASASQDKYIRVWRFRQDQHGPSDTSDDAVATAKKSLSNKARQVGGPTLQYAVTFEALLIGHEDWVYSVRWSPSRNLAGVPSLLSASADNSLSIWNVDSSAGVWICNTRLGEISSQKGSTTATGSIGGFWTGLWQPDGRSVVSLSRTGSWRRWNYDSITDMWLPSLGIGGHTKEVRSLAWAPTGNYLLATSSDQTTRLFAEWDQDTGISWHEFARPQIHGYDLNCIESITENRFISGADEKLLRVFNKPKAIDTLLSKLSVSESSAGDLPDAANIPVLGLSNKAVAAVDDEAMGNEGANGNGDDREAVDPSSVVHKSTLDLDHPPLEDHLARHTLWPEHEKLYGHGYEISAVATSHDQSLVATACKASSLDHAVIRLYETREWREIKPSLKSHSLTVTNLAFSSDDNHLLSVGRDRQWAVFARSEPESSSYTLSRSNPKGHSRMILDCSWASPPFENLFATAGRDKNVKVWKLTDDAYECVATISASAAVTTVAFELECQPDFVRLVYGTEEGRVVMLLLEKETYSILEQIEFDQHISPSAMISSLRWRPRSGTRDRINPIQLAVGSEDHSVRIYGIR